jgi:hypothetical protein
MYPHCHGRVSVEGVEKLCAHGGHASLRQVYLTASEMSAE